MQNDWNRTTRKAIRTILELFSFVEISVLLLEIMLRLNLERSLQLSHDRRLHGNPLSAGQSNLA